jgi:uncharacterized membrane protein YfhO
VKGTVRWLGRSPQSARLEVDNDRDAALMVADNWYPSWRFIVDGQEVPTLKADGGLLAVFLKAGRHAVDLNFDERFFDASLGAALLGLTLLLVLALREAGLWDLRGD